MSQKEGDLTKIEKRVGSVMAMELRRAMWWGTGAQFHDLFEGKDVMFDSDNLTVSIGPKRYQIKLVQEDKKPVLKRSNAQAELPVTVELTREEKAEAVWRAIHGFFQNRNKGQFVLVSIEDSTGVSGYNAFEAGGTYFKIYIKYHGTKSIDDMHLYNPRPTGRSSDPQWKEVVEIWKRVTAFIAEQIMANIPKLPWLNWEGFFWNSKYLTFQIGDEAYRLECQQVE